MPSSEAIFGLAAAAIAGLTGAALTYAVARRTTRGTVATSDAATLWKEANEIRAELRREIVDLRAKVARLEDEVASLKAKVATQETDLSRLRRSDRGI